MIDEIIFLDMKFPVQIVKKSMEDYSRNTLLTLRLLGYGIDFSVGFLRDPSPKDIEGAIRSYIQNKIGTK